MDVLILTGSKNDLGDVENAANTLKKFGISYEMHVSSAHRTLKRTVELVESAEKKRRKGYNSCRWDERTSPRRRRCNDYSSCNRRSA